MITVLIILSSLSFLILLMGFFNIRLPFVKANKKNLAIKTEPEVTSTPDSRSGVRVTKTARHKEEEIPARYSTDGYVRLIHLP